MIDDAPFFVRILAGQIQHFNNSNIQTGTIFVYLNQTFNLYNLILPVDYKFRIPIPVGTIHSLIYKMSSLSRSSSTQDIEAIASARKAKRARIEAKPQGLDDCRISHLGPLLPPCCLLEQLPLTNAIADVVSEGRTQVSNIIQGLDDRLICIVGPCSVHDTKAAKEYALVRF
jgi:hypothetical protein